MKVKLLNKGKGWYPTIADYYSMDMEDILEHTEMTAVTPGSYALFTPEELTKIGQALDYAIGAAEHYEDGESLAEFKELGKRISQEMENVI